MESNTFQIWPHGEIMRTYNVLFNAMSSPSVESLPLIRKCLYNLLFQLRGTNRQRFDVRTIPGSFFRYTHPEIIIEELDLLFEQLIDNEYLVQAEENVIAALIAQIAAYDFEHFVDKIVPVFLEKTDQVFLHLYVSVALIISDPTTGFLRNAPFSPKNCEWEQNQTKFNFFSPDSPDMQTKFGKALVRYRNTIRTLVEQNIIKPIPEIKYTKLPTIFVPSLMLSVQTIIVPPMFRSFNLSCGFPGRVEILLAISQFQHQNEFKKTKGYDSLTNHKVTTAWSDYYETITGFKSLQIIKPMEFAPSEDCSRNLLIRLLKLSLFTHFPHDTIIDYSTIREFVISCALGSDPQLMPFVIVWVQAIISVRNSLAPAMFKSICSAFDKFHILSSQQQYTFFHLLARFLDIYVCFTGRRIDLEDMVRVISFSLVGLASVQVPVRHAAMKVLVSIGRFNESPQYQMLEDFIAGNRKLIIMRFLKFLDNQPASLLKARPPRPFHLLTFELILASTNQTLWQLMYAALAQAASFTYDWAVLMTVRRTLFSLIRRFYERKEMGRSFSADFIVVNTLTALAALTAYGERWPNAETNEILEMIVSTADLMHRSFGPQVRTMLLGLNATAFDPMLAMLEGRRYSNELVGMLLNAMAWNTGFSAASADKSFLKRFIGVFKTHTNELAKKGLISFEFLSAEQYKIREKNRPVLCDFASTAFKIFAQVESIFSCDNEMPFPCMNFMYITEDEVVREISIFFEPLYNICLMNEQSRMRSYAIKALTKWLATSLYNNIAFISSNKFLSNVHEFSEESPDIFAALLTKNFEVLFPRFLSLSMTRRGDPFFNAICQFFRPKIDNNEIDPEALLVNHIWPSVKKAKSRGQGKYLQVIYENCGSFIVTCLYYLVRPQKALTDSAFMVLASLFPVIDLVRMNGRNDHLTAIFTFFLHICQRFPRTLSLIDGPTIEHISKKAAELFPFCMEQLLAELMDNLPKYPPDVSAAMIHYTIPWFRLVKFDLENRVISRETELLFMRFSCFSFVDKVFQCVSHVASDNPNSTNNDIWRALCLDGDSPSSNIPVILYSITDFNDPVIHVIRYIYTISASSVLEYLMNFLGYNYAFTNEHQLNQEVVDQLSIFDSEEPSRKSSFSGDAEDEQPYLVLAILRLLCLDSISPIFPYLPRILCFCLLFEDQQPETTTQLVHTIFTEIQPFVNKHGRRICDDILSRFALLPNRSDVLSAIDTATNQFSLPEGSTSWVEISVLFFKFFKLFDRSLIPGYSLECLRWGLCEGDLVRASIALELYQGAIFKADTVVVGLAARSLSSASKALTFLMNESKDTKADIFPLVNYIRTMLKTMLAVAEEMMENGMLAADSSIFWMAMDSLKCNTSLLSPIFNEGMSVLEFFFKNPQLFECVSGMKKYTGHQFTLNTFWKLHHPWGDRFPGCSRDVLGFTGKKLDIPRVFRFLNLIVQLNCPALFSDTKEWMYTAILALLPWFWSVVITDISRFLLSTPKVLMMMKTIDTLSKHANEEIGAMLRKMFFESTEEDMFTMVSKLIEEILRVMNIDDLSVVCNFYANCLRDGSRPLIVPLYAVAACIILQYDDPGTQNIADCLSRFTAVAEMHASASPDVYVELYFNSLEPLREKQKVEMQIPEEPPSSANGTPPRNQPIFVGFPIRASSPQASSVPPRLPSPIAAAPQMFPSLDLFDRIVAVLIPHLYDAKPPKGASIDFGTPASFPQLIPYINGLQKSKAFSELNAYYSEIDVAPFCHIADYRAKMHASLIDLEALNEMRKTGSEANIDYGESIRTALAQLQKAEDAMSVSAHSEMEDVDDVAIEDYGQSFELFPLLPTDFIPSVQEVNAVGEDLFLYYEEEDY